ncbi:hypothetical protein BZA77DRAFT_29369 [Pyronema omphalodes]|nr:hypothetical protein BZA77DRAFT_29369 [Pyronema omphalodes]
MYSLLYSHLHRWWWFLFVMSFFLFPLSVVFSFCSFFCFVLFCFALRSLRCFVFILIRYFVFSFSFSHCFISPVGLNSFYIFFVSFGF